MILLVTGASGFVGRELVASLAAEGITGTATGRMPPPVAVRGWQACGRAAVLAESPAPGSTPEAIVHLEVKQHVPRPTAADVAEFEAVNVGGTREWLDWAARNGVPRFVLVSSIKAVAPGPGPMTEDALPERSSPYGRSKAEAEQAVRGWAAADDRRSAVILRPAPVYGPGNEANLAAFVRQILASKPCLIGAGATRKSVVSRRNLCAAIAFATTRVGPGCHVFNVSDPATVSLADLATTIADLGGAPPPRRIPDWLATLAAPVGDAVEAVTGRDFPLTSARLRAIRETTIFPCDRLLAAGFRHPQTTRDGLAEMVAWASQPR
ncbi:MAG: NAD-dependent epimerase/dehydratase family protein [Planctomycetaceae bacterium]